MLSDNVKTTFLAFTTATVFLVTGQSHAEQLPNQGQGVRYEAEDADMSPNTFVKGGMLNALNRDGASCVFTVDGGKGGVYFLTIGYATELPEAIIQMVVNGEAQTLKLAGTGSWVETATHEMTVELKSGSENQIAFESKGHGVNLDYVELKPEK